MIQAERMMWGSQSWEVCATTASGDSGIDPDKSHPRILVGRDGDKAGAILNLIQASGEDQGRLMTTKGNT